MESEKAKYLEEYESFRQELSSPALILDENDALLYLGDGQTAGDLKILKSLNISSVLTIASNFHALFPLEFTYKCVDVSEHYGENILTVLNQCIEFIDDGMSKGMNIFCHSSAGCNRAPAVIAAYLMKRKGLSLEESLELIVSGRKNVAITPTFIEQLEYFAECNFDVIKDDSYINWCKEREYKA